MPGMFGGDQLDDDYAPWSKTKVEQSNDSGLNLDHLQAMAKALLDVREFHSKSGDIRCRYCGSDLTEHEQHTAKCVTNIARAALANQPAPLDADEMTRVRRLMKALGHADAFEQPDEYVRGILCTLLGQASGELERANQPAPTVPAGALVATITGSDTVIGRESRGLQWVKGVKAFDFEPGTRLYAHQPAQEQASTTRVTETKRTQLEARGYKVVGYVMQNSVKELCTLTHGRVEWLKS